MSLIVLHFIISDTQAIRCMYQDLSLRLPNNTNKNQT